MDNITNLDMGGFSINNLEEPTLGRQASTISYVDGKITSSMKPIGSTKQVINPTVIDFSVRLSKAAGPTIK